MSNYPNGPYPPQQGPHTQYPYQQPVYPQPVPPKTKTWVTALAIIMTGIVVCFGMLVIAAMIKNGVCTP